MQLLHRQHFFAPGHSSSDSQSHMHTAALMPQRGHAPGFSGKKQSTINEHTRQNISSRCIYKQVSGIWFK
ncbi:hypothetical protein DPMN_128224 [Dreissena polymorpha]|uniref:Uncharacterized protein n=1 Tax=Dreissena polymorpha TaxID=45954 RepID=A0A9D4JX72_DREPO|nr:hypothetical protein DPMN_128224 [Dreissena polymorpha]